MGLADPAHSLPPSFHVPNMWRLAAQKLRPKPPGPRRRKWLKSARPNQLPPDGVWWFVWFILAGRGFGKTRSGAEHIAQFGRENPGAQIGVIGRTDAEARRILLKGPSGLLSVLEPSEIARCTVTPGDTQLELTNGTIYYIAGANSPDALRGLNLWAAWCDELAAWRYQQVIWDEVLMPAVRIGPHPHVLVTTTPKPTRLVRSLLNDDTTVVVRGSTFDNIANLAASFITQMRKKYEGTRAGRQELYAEVLEDVPGALLSRRVIEAGRVDKITRAMAPQMDEYPDHPEKALRELVVALDPSDGEEESDEQALAVVGLGWDHEVYVVHTDGMREGALGYLRHAVKLAAELGATIVIEKNHGGAYLIATLQQVMRDEDVIVPYRVVKASDGKRTRAEPVGALFEQRHVHMVGDHPDVEDQLCTWTGRAGEKSPDRLDALVWGVTHFLGHALDAEEDAEEGVYSYGEPGNPGEWADDGQDYEYA